MKNFVIIGGVAGGASAAAKLRRLSEEINIIMIERGDYISYANCGLPYYIGDTIKEWDNLFVQTKESFGRRFNIDIRINHEALSIDRTKKVVKVKDLLNNSITEIKYDKLLLSPGAEPFKPNIPGIDDKRIFTLRNPKDTISIKNYIKEKDVKKAIIVGAGFIGLELAENLHNLGIKVSIVELAPQVMPQLDFDMATEIHQYLKSKNVEFYLNDQVISFQPEQLKIGAKLNSGKIIFADIIILSIGVKPESKLAKEAGLNIGSKGGILVDEFLQTSDPDIFAVGDAIEGYNYLLGKNIFIPLAGPANKQARIAAENMLYGPKVKYNGSIGTSIAKVFDLTVASVGLSEKVCINERIDYEKIIIHGSSHAGYYPGALPLTLKVIIKRDNGKILGAQAIGYEGIDKRIDIISSFIQKNGTIYDLSQFEHAYAPPYSSAKDPINIAGFVGENILKGRLKQIYIENFLQMDKNEIFLLDVRTEEEFKLGSIQGAINIPVDELRRNLNKIPKNKKIIIFCGVGLRGYIAYRILNQNGFDEVYNLAGGYKSYQYYIQKQSNEDIFENDYIGIDDHIYQIKSKSNINIDQNLNELVKNALEIDACGLQCPGPILKLKKEIEKINNGDFIVVKATDPGFKKDIYSWAKISGNNLIELIEEKGVIKAILQKGDEKSLKDVNNFKVKDNLYERELVDLKKNATIIVFSNDMDKALASFILALGALSSGKKVTMFFTFWGLTILKKNKNVKTKKDLMGKMFSLMLPKNASKLGLSKMNMLGLGPIFMKIRMKQKNISLLNDLIKESIENGINFVACQMSMDVMGIKKEELIDGVEVGGVATYMEKASESNINLFI